MNDYVSMAAASILGGDSVKALGPTGGKEAGVVKGVCMPFQSHLAPSSTHNAGLPEGAQAGVGVRGKQREG